MMSAALKKLNERIDAADSLLCVGLDPEQDKVPERFRATEFPQFELNRWVIDETAQSAAAFKLNTAFYEARGDRGLTDLKMTMDYLRQRHPEVFTICDAKRADIGNTNRGYVTAAFDWLGCDAVTLHPYLGREALAPFLERRDKVCIILCRTSNAGAGELQDLEVGGRPLWEAVADKVGREWNGSGNCMLVAGATYPEEMRRIRAVAPELTLLVPGIGAQAGDVGAAVAAGLDSRGRGMILSASRAVMFSQSPGASARALRDEMNAARRAR